MPLRYTRVPSQDNSAAFYSRENITPTFAASLLLAPTDTEYTKFFISLTGALALTIGTTKNKQGDTCLIVFSADASQRIVTPTTGFSGLTGTTLTIAANKKGTLSCVFDGTNWIETARSIGA